MERIQIRKREKEKILKGKKVERIQIRKREKEKILKGKKWKGFK